MLALYFDFAIFGPGKAMSAPSTKQIFGFSESCAVASNNELKVSWGNPSN